MGFEFTTAGRIVFGAGTARQAGTIAAEMGRCVLLAGGSSEQRSEAIQHALDEAGVPWCYFAISGGTGNRGHSRGGAPCP